MRLTTDASHCVIDWEENAPLPSSPSRKFQIVMLWCLVGVAAAGFSLNTVRPAGTRTRVRGPVMGNADHELLISHQDHPPFSSRCLTRRSTVAAIASLTSLSVVWPCRAATPQLAATWKATDGFNDTSFISFDEKAYEAMRDDEGRTPLFEKAIKARLAGQEGQLTVLEIGTGPFALLALIAARAGARKVYAIEAQPEAARRARKAIRKAGFESTVEVLEGFSTAITLPEKADLVVAEIVGSIASEEGMYATIRDAQARLVKRPELASSWIPSRCQTWVAPATYALHYALGPPQFDWGKLKEPVRLSCLYVWQAQGAHYVGCSLKHTGLQPGAHWVVAWSSRGCSPECMGRRCASTAGTRPCRRWLSHSCSRIYACTTWGSRTAPRGAPRRPRGPLCSRRNGSRPTVTSSMPSCCAAAWSDGHLGGAIALLLPWPLGTRGDGPGLLHALPRSTPAAQTLVAACGGGGMR